MGEIARPLLTDDQISSFLEAIDFKTFFSDKRNRHNVFPGRMDIGVVLGESVTLIKDANKDLLDVIENNTYDSDKNRSVPYKTDEAREELRGQILDELVTKKRPRNDEKICLGTGGMLPHSGYIVDDRKAFIIIGLPASGKSGIAAKISDYFNALLIDSDFAKRKFPEYCKTNVATLVHKESKFINNEILNAAISLGLNLVLPVIGNDLEGVKAQIESLKTHRYKVTLILVELNRIKATQRAFIRFIKSKRYVPLSKVLDEYANDPSIVFYKLLRQNRNIPAALIDTDVPMENKPNIVLQQKFEEIHMII